MIPDYSLSKQIRQLLTAQALIVTDFELTSEELAAAGLTVAVLKDNLAKLQSVVKGAGYADPSADQ